MVSVGRSSTFETFFFITTRTRKQLHRGVAQLLLIYS